MQADPERISSPSHRPRLTDRGLLRRSYRLLGMIAVATLGTLLVAAYLVPFPARAWYRETLAPSADGVSMAQDESGYLHIVYSRHTSFDRVLSYMTNAGGKWSSRDLDPGSTCCASVAMDSRGRVHAAYTWWNSTYPPVVRYVTWDGQHANITPILSRTWVGSASIAVDSQDHVHLAFIASGKDYTSWNLFYGTNSGGTWNVSSVLENSSVNSLFSASLAVDAQDRVYIGAGLSQEAGSVGVFSRSGNGWRFEPVDNVSGWVKSVSLAVDPLGHLHLAYLSSETGLLRYATNLGGTWTKTDVGPSSGMFVTLRLDSSERPHIAFSDRPIGIAYATDASGVWTTSHIEEQPSLSGEPYSFALSVESGGAAHVLAVESIPPSGNALYSYSNTPPTFTVDAYLVRFTPLLVYWGAGFGASAVGILVLVRTRAARGVRRERRAWGAARYQELARLRRP